MTVAIYFAIGALLAAYFTAPGGIEQGDYLKATCMVVMCALWPVTLGLGVGLVIANILRFCRAFIAKRRSA